MKFSIIALIILTSFNAVSHTDLYPVNVRDHKMNLKIKKIQLDDLENSDLAQTSNFKILKGTSDIVIDLKNDIMTEDERIRAATVLYHLEYARNYFINTLGSEYVANLPLSNIRIEMSKPFSPFYQFLDESVQDEFNNAVTVPASSIMANPEASWSPEIWFRPAKKQEINNSVYQISREFDSINFTTTLVPVFMDQSLRDTIVQKSLYGDMVTLDYSGVTTSLLITLGLFEVIPKVLMYASKPFTTDTFLDTAMIPEVIFHEFAHLALSDHISLRKSSPLNEGIANYFAGVISQSSQVGSNNGNHSKNTSGFNGNDRSKYSGVLETSTASYSNFAMSFLWGLRKRMGREIPNGEALTDKLVYEARKYMEYSDKPIKNVLLPSLTQTVSEVFPKNQSRKIRLLINDEALLRGL